MTALIWDQVGERVYQTGIDRGVLYLHDGSAVVWNGISSVEEFSDSELRSFHLDGVKYLENLTPGDFLGKLKAFTYPDEFDPVSGVIDSLPDPGLSFHDQPPQSFNLSYRSRIGDDVEGTDRGYKIHILYNVFAKPEVYSFDTFKDSSVQPIEFGWSLTGTPVKLGGARPTVHFTIDSTKTPPEILEEVEDILYGTDSVEPTLPSIRELAVFFGYLGPFIIVDHGDGTWSAIDELDSYITMIDDTTFSIEGADAVYLDEDTYEISSTNIDH